MGAMPLTLSWTDMAIRLAATVVAGLLLGFNRDEHGKAAGMRTTLIVCLAASVAMMQMNLLLPLAGRHPDSFVTGDLMRLPLGILTGVGFIGGGAIVKRGDIVVGVTTAATLWLVTVIGLCMGGGQLVLGAITTVIGLLALWGIGTVKPWLAHEHPIRLTIELEADGPREEMLRHRLQDGGFRIVGCAASYSTKDVSRTFHFDLREVAATGQVETPAFVAALLHEPGVVKIQWHAEP